MERMWPCSSQEGSRKNLKFCSKIQIEARRSVYDCENFVLRIGNETGINKNSNGNETYIILDNELAPSSPVLILVLVLEIVRDEIR